MKNNISYYSHDCDSHNNSKFKLLRAKFGWQGEGWFWALNNLIGTADGCLLNVEKPHVQADLCDVFGITIIQLQSFIGYIEKDCELIVREGDHITTKRCQETLATINKERRRKKGGNPKNSVEKEENSAEKSNYSTEKVKNSVENKANSGYKRKERKERKEIGELHSSHSDATTPLRVNPSEVPELQQAMRAIGIPAQ